MHRTIGTIAALDPSSRYSVAHCSLAEYVDDIAVVIATFAFNRKAEVVVKAVGDHRLTEGDIRSAQAFAAMTRCEWRRKAKRAWLAAREETRREAAAASARRLRSLEALEDPRSTVPAAYDPVLSLEKMFALKDPRIPGGQAE